MGMGKPHIQKTIEKIYIIDSCALINLFRHSGLPYEPYPEDLFPNLWKKIKGMTNSGILISHTSVYKEISRKDDQAKDWCEKNKRMFKDVDECQLEVFQQVRQSYDPHYWKRELNKNSEWADPWIIALSVCHGNATIVTDEKMTDHNNPNVGNRIPDIARKLNIPCMNLMDFLREVGI
jgi:hypothetical protein